MKVTFRDGSCFRSGTNNAKTRGHSEDRQGGRHAAFHRVEEHMSKPGIEGPWPFNGVAQQQGEAVGFGLGRP